jgi:hypothetical protein
VWCGTHGGGLFLFGGNNWTQYTNNYSPLPSDYVGYIAVDNDNIAWLNCRDPRYPDDYGLNYGFGLTRFDGTSWTTYNRSNSPIPSDCLYDIKIDANNTKWLATAGDVGLVSFNGSDWHTYNVDNSGIALNEVTRITLDARRDLIWLTHYTGSGLSVAKLNCLLSGDVNGDGKVNVSDVTTLVNMILVITPMNKDRADIDGNGMVNVSDVTTLINIILGII